MHQVFLNSSFRKHIIHILTNEFRDLGLLILRFIEQKSKIDGNLQLMHLSASCTYLNSFSSGQGDVGGGFECFFFKVRQRGRLVPMLVLYLYLFSDSMLVIFLVLLRQFVVVYVVLVVNASLSLKMADI